MKNRKLMNMLLIILPLGAVLLNPLPDSVRMRFADQDGPFYSYESGFSLIPVGYANWGHMLAGIGAGMLAVLAVICWLHGSEKGYGRIFGLALAAAIILVLCMLLFGSGTVYSWQMAAALAAEALLAYRMKA